MNNIADLDHWIYGDNRSDTIVCPRDDGSTVAREYSPMVFRMGVSEEVHHIEITRKEFTEKIRQAGKYAVRESTMNGATLNFDPDVLLEKLVEGFLGYFTLDGLPSLNVWPKS